MLERWRAAGKEWGRTGPGGLTLALLLAGIVIFGAGEIANNGRSNGIETNRGWSDLSISNEGLRPLTATANANPTNALVGQTVYFWANDSACVPISSCTWSWDFGDGGTASTQNATHSFSTAGSAQVQLHAGIGAPNDAALVTVTVANALSVSISSSPTSLVAGQQVSFASTVSGGFPMTNGDYSSYVWSFGDGTSSSNPCCFPGQVTHSYATSGSYTAKLTVTDTTGAEASGLTFVEVGMPTLTASAQATPQAPSAGEQVSFSASATGGTGGYSYAWSFGDGSTGSGQQTTHAYSSAGSFTATVTVTDSHGDTTSATVAVTVGQATGGSGQTGLDSGTVLIIGVVLVVAVILVAIAAVARSRKRRRQDEAAGHTEVYAAGPVISQQEYQAYPTEAPPPPPSAPYSPEPVQPGPPPSWAPPGAGYAAPPPPPLARTCPNCGMAGIHPTAPCPRCGARPWP